MANAEGLDPHQRPPNFIKNVYKYYQKLPTTAFESDPKVFDLQHGSKPTSETGVVECGKISRSIIDTSCSIIEKDYRADLDTLSQDVVVYEAKDIPGLRLIPSLVPEQSQRDLLSLLLHRDLADPRHRTNVHLHHQLPYHATREMHLFTADSNCGSPTFSFFNMSPTSTELFPPVDAEAHRPITVSQFLGRKLRWITLGGQYDWTKKRYPLENPSFPADLAAFTQSLFPDMKAEAAIVNVYSPGDTLSMHRDVSEDTDKGLLEMATEKATWQSLAKAKLASINDSIPSEWRLATTPSVEEQRDVTGDFIARSLSKREIEITETDAVDIVEKTSSGRWSAEEVTTAFCHRASLAHQLTSCLHETFFDAALEEAKGLDKYYAQHKALIGPLHGLPVSLKDQFHVKGVETTMGYVGWIGTFMGKKGTGQEKVYESEMVKELRALGAVLYCKTSVPHSLMSGETINNIIGYTTNPKNQNLSAGGSSGGEGALISLKGSPVGFGTDIGGSIRIPAAFCGLYGLRPSAGRLPYEGMANSMDGQNSILSVVGPLSQSAASLRLVVKSLLSQQPWLHDPLCHEIPWREDHQKQMQDLVSTSTLVFGIIKHDGVVTPHPPLQRALDTVTKTVEKLGHKVIEWKPPSHEAGIDILLKTWTYDGGADVHGALGLSGEPIAPQVSVLYGSEPSEQADASKIAATNIAKREYQKAYMEYWNSTIDQTGTGRPVDALIAPAAPFAAARPNSYKYYGYSSIFNVLDYSACVFPVTNVDKNVDVIKKDFQPLNDLDQEVANIYDPEVYDGAHVSLQLVGRRLQEEKVLALAEFVGNAMAEAK